MGVQSLGTRGETPFFSWRFRAIRLLPDTIPPPTGITYKILSREDPKKKIYVVCRGRCAGVKFSTKFSAFGGVPSGPACSPVGIVPLWLGAFGERDCLRDVGLLVVSGFAGGESFAGEALFEFCW